MYGSDVSWSVVLEISVGFDLLLDPLADDVKHSP